MTVAEYIEQNNIDKDVTSLNISSKGITSLEGIEELKNLTYLFCMNNQLTSLSAIRDLKNLTKLYCWNNPLPHQPNLEAFKEWFILENRRLKLELIREL